MMRIIDLEIGTEVQVEAGYTNWNRADDEFYCTVSGISEDAVEIIKDVADTQLDAELVDIFLTIPKEELEKCTPEEVKY